MNKTKKRIRLDNLVDGSPFIIPSLEKEFRLMYLVRGGDSTCRVQGYKITESGGYSPFADFFSPGTEVVFDSARSSLKVSENSEVSIPKEHIANLLDKKQENKKEKNRKVALKMKAVDIEKKNKVGAGRPKKHSINLPKGEEFTVCQIASKLGVDKFVVNNEISRIKRENPEALSLVGSSSRGKGKPAKVWKLI